MNNNYEQEDDDVIELIGANGELMKFVEIAGIAYCGNFYAILQPVELLEGMEEDEALVFKITSGKNGKDRFALESNDAIVDAVFEEYNRLLDEAEAKNKTSSNRKNPSRGSAENRNSSKPRRRSRVGRVLIPLILTIFFFVFSNSIPFLLIPLGIASAIWFIIALVRLIHKG